VAELPPAAWFAGADEEPRFTAFCYVAIAGWFDHSLGEFLPYKGNSNISVTCCLSDNKCRCCELDGVQ
jgi:hypothetical protein